MARLARAVQAGDALGMPGEVKGSCLEAVETILSEKSPILPACGQWPWFCELVHRKTLIR